MNIVRLYKIKVASKKSGRESEAFEIIIIYSNTGDESKGK